MALDNEAKNGGAFLEGDENKQPGDASSVDKEQSANDAADAMDVDEPPVIQRQGETTEFGGTEDDDDSAAMQSLDDSSTAARNATDDEDPDSGGEEVFEPDTTKINRFKFSNFCKMCEKAFQQKERDPGAKKGPKASKEQILEMLLPIKYLNKKFEQVYWSAFPLLRLYMPDIDSSRPHTGMKEKTIAKAYIEAFSLGPHSEWRRRLEDPNEKKKGDSSGDLSLVVQELVEEMKGAKWGEKSAVTIGQINMLLDELVKMKNMKPGTHEYQSTGSSEANKKTTKAKKLSQKRAEWVRALLDDYQISPLEHRWIVRILLQSTQLVVGHKAILKHYSPYAEELYNSNNSLKYLCTALSNPEWMRRRREQEEREKLGTIEDRLNYLPRSRAEAKLGNTISPMLAKKTTCASITTDLSVKHRDHAKNLRQDEPGASSLALKFPPFICEVKLDGERMVVHVNRGIVTMQTRSSKWYSQRYSPTLGPSLRRAIASYDIDVILDGEVMAWDNTREEFIAFGANRTVAKARAQYCARKGMLDERDLNLHKNASEDLNVEIVPDDYFASSTVEDRDEGSDIWLRYLVFDVLYVGGPGAADLIDGALAPENEAGSVKPGSIVSLDGLRRKRILHRLLQPEKDVVEFVPSLLVRPNGDSMRAEDYFSPCAVCEDSGLPLFAVDSIDNALRNTIPNLEQSDSHSRGPLTDADISARRANAMEQFYVEIVEKQRLEGVVFKDLAAPYIIGEESRKFGYWFKHKPDYEADSFVSDIDTAVLGAYYASGLKKAGMPNAFLVGCVDNENPGKFMTLCKVSGGGIAWPKFEKILKFTKFQQETEYHELDLGHWFKEKDHGNSLPDFISPRTLQQQDKGNGWIFDRAKTYPSLWIRPEHSFVLTLKAGEYTASDSFSAGLTLRFPRIEKVRIDGVDDDEKPLEEVEPSDWFMRQYQKQTAAREGSTMEFSFGSPERAAAGKSRFLTVEEREKNEKETGGRKKKKPEISRVPHVDRYESSALNGLSVVVLDGIYLLDESSLDAENAQEEGWFEEASHVSSKDDIIIFVKKHGGRYHCAETYQSNELIVGGRGNDPKLEMTKKAMTRAAGDTATILAKDKKECEKIQKIPGVLKWTYLYSAVHHWLLRSGAVKVEEDEKPPSDYERGAADDKYPLIPPKRHNYIYINPSYDGFDEFDIFGIEFRQDVTVADMKRALEQVRLDQASGEHKRKRGKLLANSAKSDVVPWQYATMSSLEESERFIMFGARQVLGCNRSTKSGPAVLYPDVFTSGLGSLEEVALENSFNHPRSARWGEISDAAKLCGIMSALPLATHMGAQLTPYLHNGVTHVVCELKKKKSMQWDPDEFDCDAFVNELGARRIHRRLLYLHGEDSNPQEILFVTPQWIRETWEEAST